MPRPVRSCLAAVAFGCVLAASTTAVNVALADTRTRPPDASHSSIDGASVQDSSERPGSGLLYATSALYAPAQNPRSYQPAPAGFAPVFTEMVARHGARALSDEDDITLLEEVIAYAQAEGKLTSLGSQLLPELTSLAAANTALGWGELSSLGKQEHADLAKRLLQRLPTLFTGAASTGRHITVLNSGVTRAAASGTAFTTALTSRSPALAALVNPPVTDKKTLYFHKSAANADYTTWVDNDPVLAAKLKEITYSPESQADAVKCLRRLFASDFVDRLADGAYMFSDGDGGKVVRNAVDATIALYNVYVKVPGLSGEGTWHFERFIDTKVAAHFGYVDDADNFYRKGPSFAGSSITFNMAKVLEADFFSAVTAYRNGTSTDVARLRFAHAETVIPLAAVMQLPRSNVQVPATKTYTYDDNPWRGATVAPYAANMQWDVFRNSSGRVLVRMLYNEAETRFKTDCKPYASGSAYYDFDELKRCYGY